MPTHRDAFAFLDAEGPRLFGTAVGSMLYVGHQSCTAGWWHKKFAPALGVTRIAVLDIEQSGLDSARHITQELILLDVRSPHVPGGFGLVFWDEGPEHLPREEALRTLRELMFRNRAVLASCPWGLQPQGKDPTTPDFHHWGPEPGDLESIGLVARTFGEHFDGRGAGFGNLLAWTPAGIRPDHTA